MSNTQAIHNLGLRKFDMKNVKQDSVCIFIGRRRTGKSTLVRDLLWHHQDMPLGMVISGTEESNGAYSKLIPPIFVHNEYTPQKVEQFIKQKRRLMGKIKEDTEKGVHSHVDPRSFLILDDCMYDDTWTRDKNIRDIFMNGRHWKVFFLITMQYPLGIPPALRSNVDYVFILREPYLSNRQRIFQNYGGCFPSFEAFCQVLDQCTQNYECLVIDTTTQSNKLEDQIFWYKAEMRPDFRIGAPECWQISARLYKDRTDEDNDSYDPNSTRRLRGPLINVRKY